MKIIQNGEVNIDESGLHAYMPIEWAFGVSPQDGMGNPSPSDHGTIYVSVGADDDEINPTTIAFTLNSLVDCAIEGWWSPNEKTISSMHHASADKLSAEFRRLADHIQSCKTVGASHQPTNEN